MTINLRWGHTPIAVIHIWIIPKIWYPGVEGGLLLKKKKKKFIGSDREHSFFDDIKILMLLHLYIFSLLYSVQVEGLVKLLIWPLLSSCFYFKLFHLASFLNFGGFGSVILVSKDNNLASLVLQFSEESFYLGFGV